MKVKYVTDELGLRKVAIGGRGIVGTKVGYMNDRIIGRNLYLK